MAVFHWGVSNILFTDHAPKYPGHLICRVIEQQQQQQKLLVSFILAAGTLYSSYSMFLHSIKWKMQKSSN